MLRGSRGQRFDGEYEELESLGTGTFREVIKVKHKNDDILYAIKEIKDPRLESSPETEAKILASLEHANIVKYSDCFFSDMPPELERTNDEGELDLPRKRFYIRMELCDSDLSKFTKIRQLSCEEVWHVMRSLVSALEYLESRKLMHGDIKLANILLKKNSNSRNAEPLKLLWCTVKLGDFGVSSFVEGGSFGSSIKSDILRLGRILLEMLIYPPSNEDLQRLMEDAMHRGELPESLDPRERTLLRTERGGMLHPNEDDRSDVATVKNHMEMWYNSRSSRGTAPF